MQLLAAQVSERTLLKHAAVDALAGLTPGLLLLPAADGLLLVASSNGLTTLLLVFVRVLVPLLVLVGLLFWALTLMQLLFLSLAGMVFTLELSNAAEADAMLTTGCGFSTGREAAIRS